MSEQLFAAIVLILGAVAAFFAGLARYRGKQVQKAKVEQWGAEEKQAKAEAQRDVAKADEDELTDRLRDALRDDDPS